MQIARSCVPFGIWMSKVKYSKLHFTGVANIQDMDREGVAIRNCC